MRKGNLHSNNEKRVTASKKIGENVMEIRKPWSDERVYGNLK
jgi:hypothetical protein